jgi:hypothetical protein
MGTGRSGSTVLEILLSQSGSTFGAGELFNLLKDGYQKNSVCSCGELFGVCSIWAEIKRRVPITINENITLQVESKKLEKHWGCFLSLIGLENGSKRYFEFNERILKSLQNVCGTEFIIDSSKYPGRALALRKLLGRKIWVIWLTRKPEGILHSFQKPNKDEQKPKRPVIAAVYVAYVTLMGSLVKRQLGQQCLAMKYEDLIEDPIRQMNVIESWSGVDLSHTKKLVSENIDLSVGHLITANRIRKSNSIKLSTEINPINLDLWPTFLKYCLNAWYRVLGIHS